jgi:hypothetical protein
MSKQLFDQLKTELELHSGYMEFRTFKVLETLQEEMERAQGKAKALGDRLHAMNQLAWRQAHLLDTLVDAFLAGDEVLLKNNLQVMADHRAKQLALRSSAH